MRHPRTFEPDHVAPATLRGRRLPSARRRFAAAFIDVLALLPVVVVVALSLALTWVLATHFDGTVAVLRLATSPVSLTADERDRQLAHALPFLLEVEAEGLPTEARLAIERGELDKARELLRDKRFDFTLQLDEAPAPAIREDAVRVKLGGLLPTQVTWLARFGILALYFTVFTSGGRVTLGKRLLGMEVVRLDGTPLGWWEAFERFGGYSAMPGTAMLGLLDYVREPNGRPAHDRMTGSVVLMRERAVVGGRPATPVGRDEHEDATPDGQPERVAGDPANRQV